MTNLKFTGSKELLLEIKSEIDLSGDSKTSELLAIEDDSNLGFNLDIVWKVFAVLATINGVWGLVDRIINYYQKTKKQEKLVIETDLKTYTITLSENVSKEELIAMLEKLINE